VLQVRAETVLSFPRGDHAMVLYTATSVEESLVAICTAIDALTDEFRRRLPE